MAGVLGPSTVSFGVGQRTNHVKEIHKRARVAVQQQHRRRILMGRADMYEVNCLSIDLSEEVGELIHPGLLGSPIKRGSPVLDHVAQPGHRCPVPPVVARGLCGEAGTSQTGSEVIQTG